MAEIHCRHFNGYKPCGKSLNCDRGECASFASVKERILIVHLEALGAVLRSTSLLSAIQRRYPGSLITWVTKAPADRLLKNLNEVDRVLTVSAEDLLTLSALTFDLAFVIDKSIAAWGIVKHTKVDEVRGFRADPVNGAIVPANPEATELWSLGLDNHKKFFVNVKSEQQLVHEALKLGEYTRSEYRVELSAEERQLAGARRQQWSPVGCPVIGINTGCSGTLPAKKLSVDGHRELIHRILYDTRFAGSPVVLLGGPEDTERNELIARDLPVYVSPTQRGLRDGLVSVEACDVIVSGDSLGMHMGIGLRKWMVTWFGPTCAQEIDLYERGRKILTMAGCSPCWKKACGQPVMCYDQVDFDQVLDGLSEGFKWLTSFSKPRFPEISFSPFL
jgi:heptosyltransferase II